MPRAALFILCLAVSSAASLPAKLKRHTYSTSFRHDENPLTERGKWVNGKAAGLDWADVCTVRGLASGTESGRIKYDDSTAVLTGDWNPDQSAEAVVHTANQSDQVYEEVELRLRSALSPHSATGYEINFRCLKTDKAYCQIVRWNGKLGDFTYVATKEGAEYGVKDGDIVRANIVGNVITAYINGRQVLQGRDGTFSSGSPGIGFYQENSPERNRDFGFTRFKAWD